MKDKDIERNLTSLALLNKFELGVLLLQFGIGVVKMKTPYTGSRKRRKPQTRKKKI